MINVTAEGTVIVGGQDVGLEGLRGIVTSAIADNPDQKVSVRGDRGASYGDVAAALDVCKAAGVNDPFLDTVPAN
ncbi:MAG: biopolymer transporter ExbD [Planctomycetota bacterium]